MRPQPLPDGEFNRRARQRVTGQAEIASGKRVIPRSLEARVDIASDDYGTRFNEVPLEAWKQLAERTLPPDKQSVSMSRLRRTRAMGRPVGKRVALEHDDLLEMIR